MRLPAAQNRAMRSKTLCVVLLAGLLGGCTSYRVLPGYPVCATQPGTWECQVEQYEKVDS